MLQCQFVLAHLTEDRTDVQVDVCRVKDLQTVVHGLVTIVQVVIFDFKGLLEVAEGRAELFLPPEYASEVVICNCPVLVALFRQRLGLSKQF